MITELRAHLRGAAGVAAIVGTRVEWAKLPQASALPAIVLNAISAAPGYTLQGRTRLIGELVQIDCWARDEAGRGGFLIARDLAAAVRAALDLLATPPLQAIIENQRSDIDTAEGRPDLYRTSLDVRVWHSPTA